MEPFSIPRAVITSLKEKAESLYQCDDQLYVGTSTGNLYIYKLGGDQDAIEGQTVTLLEIKKSLVKRSIDQLSYIKEINSLVVLSDMTVTLFPLPGFAPPTPLVKVKAAFSFGVHTCTQHPTPLPDSEKNFVSKPTPVPLTSLTTNPIVSGNTPKNMSTFDDANTVLPIPSIVTQLLVGCRRKVVIYSWKDGEAQEVKEAPLPHSPRAISFLTPEVVGFAYVPDYAMFNISSMSVIDIILPLPTTTSIGMGKSTFSGLTGYMSLGLGAKAKPMITPTSESEVLIVKDNEGVFIGKDGRPSREKNLEWVAPPDEIAFIPPYVFSIFPGGSVPMQVLGGLTESVATPTIVAGQQVPSMIPTSVVHIQSSISTHTQIFPIPFRSLPTNMIATTSTDDTATISTTTQPTVAHNATIHIPLFSLSMKSPLYIITTPTDRNLAVAEGSTIWQFIMRPWVDQIDQFMLGGLYADALRLIDVIEDDALPDKEQRRSCFRALNAVSQFRARNFDEAIDTFSKLELNPAKVVALYPESISGRLAIPQRDWIQLYGGPTPPDDPCPLSPASQTVSGERRNDSDEGHVGPHDKSESLDTIVHADAPGSSTLKKLKGAGPGLLSRYQEKDDDTASVHNGRRGRDPVRDEFRHSIETLTRYLVDRRTKLGAALASVSITPQNQYNGFKPLSEVPVADLFALPDAPLSALTPEQLLRFSQIVDTALYKSYIVIRPGLLSSFCRLPNWCEVSEVEEDLRGLQRFLELKDLYYGKKMHAKALQLLRELSERPTDMGDQLRPSIAYLQKLGPEYLDIIFQFSQWIFERDTDMAFEIFMSEDVELPHQAVASYLENIDPKICARYLEFIIDERHEESPVFHDRLAELYIKMSLMVKRRNEGGAQEEIYTKLLKFLNTNERISAERLYGLLSSTDLYEARAILLGRLGRHDQALELYAYRLHDYLKAEEYCKRIYQPRSPTSSVYLTLLRIYLRPNSSQIQVSPADLLQAALDLISRHKPRLDPVETLNLLPPLVNANDVHGFLLEVLRAPVFGTKVVRCVSKARNDAIARKLVALQGRKVKVTDSRICPQCHKRIGNSVIAVHAPYGEVTHYQCREAFSHKLNESRA